MSSSAPTSSSEVSVLTFGLIAIALLPLVVLVFLYVTAWDVRLGRILGVNLPADSNLVIYNAVCAEGRNPQLTVTYWTSQSAPLALEFDQTSSPTLDSQAGINTLEITLTRLEVCPQSLILSDLSRGRKAGSVVERIQ